MRVLAYQVGAQVLYACCDTSEALHLFAQAGAQADDWLWFAPDGAPLRLEQNALAQRFLRPWASCSSCRLAQILPYVQSLNGDATGAALAALCAEFGATAAPVAPE